MIITDLSWLSLPLAAVTTGVSIIAARALRRRATGDPEAGITSHDTVTIAITAAAILLSALMTLTVITLRADVRFLAPIVAGAAIGLLAALARRRSALAAWRWTAVGALIGAVTAHASQVAYLVFTLWLNANLHERLST